MPFDYAAHDAQMATEIRNEVADAALGFEMAIGNLRAGVDVEGALERLKRQSNNLRLLCTGIEDRLLDLAVQRFANYLLLVTEPSEHQLDDLEVFVDMMNALASGEIEATGDEAEFVRSLPVPRPASLDDVAHLDLEVLLVDPQRVGARFVARELQNCGFRVTMATRSYEALELAARTRPDLVITSAVLDEIDGIELCRILQVATATSHIPLALLTSFERDDDRLRKLPEPVAFLRKGGAFSDDMGDLLESIQARSAGSAAEEMA